MGCLEGIPVVIISELVSVDKVDIASPLKLARESREMAALELVLYYPHCGIMPITSWETHSLVIVMTIIVVFPLITVA